MKNILSIARIVGLQFIGIALFVLIVPGSLKAQGPDETATVAEGIEVDIAVTVAGTAPFSYVWTKDGVTIPGQTSARLILPAVTTVFSGRYVCTVTNPAGSTVSNAAVLTVKPTVNPPSAASAKFVKP